MKKTRPSSYYPLNSSAAIFRDQHFESSFFMEKIQPEIRNREDVKLLVTTFYAHIRMHKTLGPIFNKMITDWPAHLELLTNFWESQLFLNKKYSGNPITVHQDVDRKFDHQITMEHFGQWLEVWISTLDELFTGERAWIAKNRARKMATMFYLKIYENRS